MSPALSLVVEVLGVTVEPVDGLCDRCWKPSLVRVTCVLVLNSSRLMEGVREGCADCG